jgi:hypothetical protein
MDASFLDPLGHLMEVDTLNQAQLVAMTEWLTIQDDLWRPAKAPGPFRPSRL